MKKYVCAIVGCGRIASTMDDDPKRKNISTHAGAFKNNKLTHLKFAAEPNITRRNKFKKKWNIERMYCSYEEMFSKENIDIVSICTHADLHVDITKLAVRSGVKGILCEKPMACTIEEAIEIKKLVAGSGVVFGMCHVRRTYLGIKKAKQLIDSGKIGKIQSVHIVYCAGISNQAIHILDTLRYLIYYEVDQLLCCHHQKISIPGELNITGFMISKTGVPCTIQTVARENYTAEEIHLFGEKGKIVIDHMSSGIAHYVARKSKRFGNFKELSLKQEFSLEEGPRMSELVDNLVFSIEGKSKVLSSVDDGLSSVSMVSGLIESCYKKVPIKYNQISKNIKI